MPTYNYRCNNCSQEYEQNLRMSEMLLPLENECDKCGQKGHIVKIIVSGCTVVQPNQMKTLDGDFKFAMNQMKKRHPRSNIPTY